MLILAICALVNRSLFFGSARRRALDPPPGTFANILRAVAKTLFHIADNGPAPATIQNTAIQAVAPAAGKFDSQNAKIRSLNERRAKRITRGRPRRDDRGLRIRRRDKARLTRQQGRPQPPGPIPRRDDEIRQGAMKIPVFLGQIAAHNLAGPIFDVTDTKARLNLSFAGMKRR